MAIAPKSNKKERYETKMSLLQEMQMTRHLMGEEKSDALERYREETGADLGKTIYTLDGWNKFEEWQIEIAAHTHLDHKIEILQQQLFLFFHSQIQHRIDTGCHIRTIVVETFGRILDVKWQSEISCLDLLSRHLAAVLFAKNNTVLAKMHCWQCTQREMCT